MKKILLSVAFLVGSVASAAAACTSPAVMHDFAATAFNMSFATAPDTNCEPNNAITTWGGVTLGAPSNYGTSPGAVAVMGVNAFVTNFPGSQAVTGTFWQATQPVSGTFWQATQPVSGTFWPYSLQSNASSAVATGASNVPGVAYNYGFNGTAWDQLQVDASKFLKINCAAGCTGAADSTQTFSITSSTTSTALALVGTQSAAFNLTGTFSATVLGQVSNDNSQWTNVPLFNLTAGAWIAPATGATAVGNYLLVGSQGQRYARISVTYTSGTVAGVVTATSQGPSVTWGDYLNWLALTGSSTCLASTAYNTNSYSNAAVASLNCDLNGGARVTINPNQIVNNSTPIATATLASNLVVKASAGTLISFEVSADSTLSGAAWWVMIFNATTLPADGTVTPTKCYAVPSGTTSYSGGFVVPGVTFSTGIVMGVSTTGCFTKTASTHAFLSADFQ